MARPSDPTANLDGPSVTEGVPLEALSAPCADPDGRVMELEGAVAAHERRLEGLVTIASNLGKSRDPARAMRAIVAEISALLEADRTTIYELRVEDHMLWGLAVQGETSTRVGVPVGEGVAGLVASRGRSINLKDAYRHPAFDPKFDKLTGYRTRSMLCVPMRNSRKEVIGVVQVLNKREGYFTVEDERLLTALSNQAAITLEALRLQVRLNINNAELKSLSEDLRQRVEEQEVLLTIEVAHQDTVDLEAFARQVLPAVARVARVEVAALFLPEESGFGPVYYVGLPPDSTGEGLLEGAPSGFHTIPRVEVGEGALGKATSRGSPMVLSPELAEAEGIALTLGPGVGWPIRDGLTAPLRHAEQTLGALALVNRAHRHRRNAEADERLRTLLAGALSKGVGDIRARITATTRDRLMTIGQMLSGVLHDLKGPMAVISGYTQLIAEVEDSDTRRNMSETILRQIGQFNDMTREVMAFVRGERTVFARPVEIRRFVARVREQLEPEFAERGVALQIDDHTRGRGHFDEGKILRVVTNIARNARQAMGEGGQLTWTLSDTEEGELKFTLSDNGPGIPEALRDRLFELFTTAGKKGGTGLGLAIVKRIVENHHGEISFTTETGQGTTFVITLPGERPAD